MKRWAFALLIGCRARESSSPSPVVVTPQLVDGGALVTVPSPPANEPAPEGCPSSEQIEDDARRLASALASRSGSEWTWEIDEARIRLRPSVQLSESSVNVARVFDGVRAALPDLLLGEEKVDGHRMSTFYCRGELLKKNFDVLTRHAVCIEFRGPLDEVSVDRSRRLPAFAPLLVHDEEEARTIAVGHANRVLAQTRARATRGQLVAECDEARRATSLRWIIDVDTADAIDAITVDAKTSLVVDTKVHHY